MILKKKKFDPPPPQVHQFGGQGWNSGPPAVNRGTGTVKTLPSHHTSYVHGNDNNRSMIDLIK